MAEVHVCTVSVHRRIDFWNREPRYSCDFEDADIAKVQEWLGARQYRHHAHL